MISGWNRLLVFSLLLLLANNIYATDQIVFADGVVVTPELLNHIEKDSDWLKKQKSIIRPVVSELRDRWYQRGHLAANISTLDDSLSTTYTIIPGAQFVLGTLNVVGKDYSGKQTDIEKYLPPSGSIIQTELWDTGIERLLNAAGDRGFPFAKWAIRSVKVDSINNSVDIDAVLIVNQKASISEIASNIGVGRAASFVRKACGLKKGKQFKESKLHRAKSRLMRRDLFTSVSDPIVYKTSNSDSVGIWWTIKPVEHPNRFAAILGWRRDEDDNGNFSGQVNLFLGNIAGTGRQLGLDWSDDGNTRSLLQFSYLEPLLLSLPLDCKLNLNHEVVDQEYTTFKSDISFVLPVYANWGMEAGFGYDRGTFQAGDWKSSDRRRNSVALHHYRFNQYVSGWEGTLVAENGSRKVDYVDDSIETSTVQKQMLFNCKLGGELWIANNLSIAARSSWSEIRDNSQIVPLSEQYRVGGVKSVRGYNENQYHGEQVGAGSVELRIGKPARSRLYTFYDIGYFSYTDSQQIDHNGVIRGYGAGIETSSAAGDVSLAIGFPGSLSFDSAKLHVSLLQKF